METPNICAKFREEEKSDDSSQVLYRKSCIEKGYTLEYTPHKGGETLLEGWNKAAQSFPDNNCLGHIEGNKYVWRTYKQALHEAQCIAKALLTEGLIPDVCDNDKSYKFMGIYSKNRPEWTLVNWAMFHFSGTVVPLYNTLGEESLCYCINHTELSIVACDGPSFQKLLSLHKQGKITTLYHIIAFDEVSDEDMQQAEELRVQVHMYNDVVKKGEAVGDEILEEITKCMPETTESILFTSGTTGAPKGCILSHKNYLAVICGMDANRIPINHEDIYLSYLPLAHAYEKRITSYLLWKGAAIGYFNGNSSTVIKDAQLLKPTIFPAVPRVLCKLYDTVNNMIAQKEYLNKLYKVALKQKTHRINKEGKLTHLLWDSVLFNKHKEIIGGRVKLMLTGCAPISPEILRTIKCNFCVQVGQGYAQTEAGGVCFTLSQLDMTLGLVGGPNPCNKLKLQDIPDMEYFHTDKPYPRGEICVKGHNVFQGYYKAEVKNQEAFDDQGWLHTGDVAEIRPNGSVKLIDRKKNLFKLSQGEFISPEKLENIYNKSQFVAQIFVHGFSTMSYLVAVIVPDPEYLKIWAANRGLDTDLGTLVESQDLRDAIQQDLNDRTIKGGLNGLEKIKKFHLTLEMFSIENGLLTPSMKLIRHRAKVSFKPIFEELYTE
ncbi:unnamed protein product [Moneuplotes crassus]|uniref:AMP-dependent synthetase/ligase domain-containing protein n=1 Tax=Euplotes crassus TaxID=5936 RepID=A0AAD1U3K1_EUPCR|nr:unnamed protein product [Moneuplotes crassus]